MLRNLLGNKVEKTISLIAPVLLKINITPNILTLIGLATNIFAAVLFFKGLFIAGGITILFAGIFDLLDGAVARAHGTATEFGAFLDSVADRYSDLLIFGSILAYFSKSCDLRGTILTLLIISGSFLTSYTRARAELFIAKCDVGVMERAERILLLAAGSILGFLTVSLWLLAFLTNITAFHRIWHTYKTKK